jgi:predicted nucleic acid-binding protein
MNKAKSDTTLRPNYFDASAMVKLVVEEEFSDRVRSYAFAPSQSWRLCTSYCLVEALNVLKAKANREELSNRAYIAGSRRLVSLVKTETVRLVQTNFSFFDSFADAERQVRSYKIDFLDAFQLISINTSWSYLAPPSRPLLITADCKLAQAAEMEGIHAWFCRETHRPKC